MKHPSPQPVPEDVSGRLLPWFERHHRALPWRVGPAERAAGMRPDPYRVWLSEVMLQQTTIPHATRYFLAFTERWPSVQALAAASDEAVMAAWAGLGYYARARNLIACARQVAAGGGVFPDTKDGLQALPGVGEYTSGAIAAIAFDRREAAVDGNVERVVARLLALEGEWPAQKKIIKAFMADAVPARAPGAFAEAMMDLGATVCTPKAPACERCPLGGICVARAQGQPARYPVKPKRADKPERHGHVEVYLRGGEVWLERRPQSGLLGGMLGLPGPDWAEGRAPAPVPGSKGAVVHVFTHFRLVLDVVPVGHAPRGEGRLYPVDEALAALPSVFRKALVKALGVRAGA